MADTIANLKKQVASLTKERDDMRRQLDLALWRIEKLTREPDIAVRFDGKDYTGDRSTLTTNPGIAPTTLDRIYSAISDGKVVGSFDHEGREVLWRLIPNTHHV